MGVVGVGSVAVQRRSGLRTVLWWGSAGACLSPLVGAPLWAMVDHGGAVDFLPLGVALGGTLTGGLAVRVAPPGLRRRAPAIFAIGYPAAIGLWLTVVGAAAGWLVIGATAIVAVSMPLLRRVPEVVSAELVKFAAGVAWVCSLLALPPFLFGIAFIPLAVALTICTRRLAGRATGSRPPAAVNP